MALNEYCTEYQLKEFQESMDRCTDITEILLKMAFNKTQYNQSVNRYQTCISLTLTHYHTMPHFDGLKIYIAVENIVRKGEIACNKQFLLFSQCFLPYMVLIFHCKCILKCRLQFLSIWTSLKFCRLVMG